jgi:hypothetical protein
LPDLLTDIKAIAEAASQTDPTFKTTRLYIRLSAAAVRKQLSEKKSTRTKSYRVSKRSAPNSISWGTI